LLYAHYANVFWHLLLAVSVAPDHLQGEYRTTNPHLYTGRRAIRSCGLSSPFYLGVCTVDPRIPAWVVALRTAKLCSQDLFGRLSEVTRNRLSFSRAVFGNRARYQSNNAWSSRSRAFYPRNLVIIAHAENWLT